MPNSHEDTLSPEDVDSLLAAVEENPSEEENYTPVSKQGKHQISDLDIYRYNPDAYYNFKTPSKIGKVRFAEEPLNDRYITLISRDGIKEQTVPKTMPEGYVHLNTGPDLKRYGIRTKDIYIREDILHMETDGKKDKNFHPLDSFDIVKSIVRKIQKKDMQSA